MIVDRGTLDVSPIADRLLAAEAGATSGGAADAEHEDITWSNELVNHVVELKTTDPAAYGLAALIDPFNAHVRRINDHLAVMGATLMPTAMHPWMDPHREMMLWPHENSEIYAAFNRIFDCRGHGWANLQSMHLNLPFRGDEEFGRLHAAVRLVLPILPALAAASPVMDGLVTGILDNRLNVYRTNCAKVPQCAGRIIPEPVFTTDEYHASVLRPLYEALAPHDPEGIVQEEWANARGAIARFSRGSIEIRVVDVQECPAMDLALAAATIAVLKMLVNEEWSDGITQRSFAVDPLADLLDRTIRDADRAVIEDEQYLRAMGYQRRQTCTAGDLWKHLIDEARRHEPQAVEGFDAHLDGLLEDGPLARRLLAAIGTTPSRQMLAQLYGSLRDHLARGEMFRG